jgi:hypothetical protein
MTLETPSHQRRGSSLRRSSHHGAHAATFGHHAAPSRRSSRAALAAAHRERTRWLVIGSLALATPFAAAVVALGVIR